MSYLRHLLRGKIVISHVLGIKIQYFQGTSCNSMEGGGSSQLNGEDLPAQCGLQE